MKLFIITVACFGAFGIVANNAHGKPYIVDATDPMDDWFFTLFNQVMRAALVNGNITEVEEMVKSVCSSGIVSQFNSTQFYDYAASVIYGGSAEMLQLLFDNGSKFNEMPGFLLEQAICSDVGLSRLHRAELVRTLFKNGATISPENGGGSALLRCAFENGEMDIMEMLITNGVDVNARNEYNDTILHRICDSKHGFEKLKSRKVTSNDKDYNMRKLPFQLLLSKGVDINAIGGRGYTPIHLAAVSRHLEAAEMLVEAGADINTQSDKGYTPLFSAFAHFAWDLSDARTDLIKLLVQNGAVLKDNRFFNALRIDQSSPFKAPNRFCENILY